MTLAAEENPGLGVGSIQSRNHQGRQVKVVVHPGLTESQVERVIVTFLFPSIIHNTVRASEPDMGGGGSLHSMGEGWARASSSSDV